MPYSYLENLKVCSRYLDLTSKFSKNILINFTKKIYEDDNKLKCYSNQEININTFSCDICGENFHRLYINPNNEINQIDNSIINCYKSLFGYCEYRYYYNSSSNLFYCTENEECPQDFSKYIEDKKQCIEQCDKDSIYKYELNNICYNKTMFDIMTITNKAEFNSEIFEIENIQNTQAIQSKPELINNVIHELINGFNITDINNGRDKKKLIGNDLIIVLTSTENQKINENIDNITMNLGQCENLLKNVYNIS